VAAYLIHDRGWNLCHRVIRLRMFRDQAKDCLFVVCLKDGFAAGNDITTTELLHRNEPLLSGPHFSTTK